MSKTATEMREINVMCLIECKPLFYSKQEHKGADWCDAWERMQWNEELPQAEQYTIQEHSGAWGYYAEEMRLWNRELPHAEQFVKEEIINAT